MESHSKGSSSLWEVGFWLLIFFSLMFWYFSFSYFFINLSKNFLLSKFQILNKFVWETSLKKFHILSWVFTKNWFGKGISLWFVKIHVILILSRLFNAFANWTLSSRFEFFIDYWIIVDFTKSSLDKLKLLIQYCDDLRTR
jgi:hypothetical protein